MSAITKTPSFEIIPSCVASNAASRGLLMPDGFSVEGSILPQPLEDFANAISHTVHTIGSIPSMIFSGPKQLSSEKVDSGYVCPPEEGAVSPPAKPRLRSCRSVLNRQQALRNCCVAQAEDLDLADLLARLYLQVMLTISWAWTALLNDLTRLWATPSTEVDVPVAVRKGETILISRGETDAGMRPSLRRVQCLIDRGQSAVSQRESGAQEERETDDLSSLFTPEGVECDTAPRDAESVTDRLVFSADFSWLVAAISWEFAGFYLSVVSARLGLSLISADEEWEEASL